MFEQALLPLSVSIPPSREAPNPLTTPTSGSKRAVINLRPSRSNLLKQANTGARAPAAMEDVGLRAPAEGHLETPPQEQQSRAAEASDGASAGAAEQAADASDGAGAGAAEQAANDATTNGHLSALSYSR